MNQFDSLLERLRLETPSRDHKIAVVNALEECLRQTQQSFGYWEKECFSYAIAALSRNVASPDSDTNVWLHLAINSAEMSLVPSDSRNENYGRKDEAVGALTYEQLSSWLKQIRDSL